MQQILSIWLIDLVTHIFWAMNWSGFLLKDRTNENIIEYTYTDH